MVVDKICTYRVIFQDEKRIFLSSPLATLGVLSAYLFEWPELLPVMLIMRIKSDPLSWMFWREHFEVINFLDQQTYD